MRRFVIYGAGAVGGALGAELSLVGADVVLIARGAHYTALADRGLDYVTPEGSVNLRLPVVEHPTQAEIGTDDVVIIATKSQDTLGVLAALETSAPISVPIVCAQNGVANEETALRRFPNVFGVAVFTPAAHLRPGEVVVFSAPQRGILHLGRFPHGPDPMADEIGAALGQTRYRTVVHDDVRPYKYTKLLNNLVNAPQALLETDAVAAVTELARVEGRAVFAAAGIDYVPEDRYAAESADLRLVDVPGHERAGGSSWQSLARGQGSIEADYLNGEVVLLGRLHGVPTPVNELLQRLANEAARSGAAPGGLSEAEFRALLS